MFEIKQERGYYAVYKDGIFYCSADTHREAEHDIEEAEKGCVTCAHTFKGSYCVACSRNISNFLSNGYKDNWISLN